MSEFQEKSQIKIVREIEVPRLRYFKGRINYNMPLLLSGRDEEGKVIDAQRTPMTLKQLLDWRVNGTKINGRNLLRESYTDVAFHEIGNPDNSGEIKYALYSQPIARELFNSLDPQSNIQRGKLVITPDQYNAIPREDCLLIPPGIANALREDGYSRPDIRREIWRFGAEGDDELVDGNLELVKKIVGGDFSNRMGKYPSNYSEFRPWCVNGLFMDGRSNADCSSHGDDFSRLVGVAAEGAKYIN